MKLFICAAFAAVAFTSADKLGKEAGDEELRDGVTEEFSTTTTDAPTFDLGNKEAGENTAPPTAPAPPPPAGPSSTPPPFQWPPPPGPPSETSVENKDVPPAPAPEPDAPAPASQPEATGTDAPAPAPGPEATGEDWRESLGNNKISVVQVASYIGGAACGDIVDYTNTLAAFQNEFYAHLTGAAGVAKNDVAFISANCHTLSAEERGVLNIARRRRRSASDVSAITIETVLDNENVESAVNALVTVPFTPVTKVSVQQEGSAANDVELVFGLVAGEVEDSNKLDMNGNFFNGIQDACEPFRTVAREGEEAKQNGVVLSNTGKGGKGKKDKKSKKGRRSRRSRAASAMWSREAEAAAERVTRHISESRLSQASAEQSKYDQFHRMETALLDSQARERRQDSTGINECVDAAKEAKNFGFVSGYVPTYVETSYESSSNFVINGGGVVSGTNYASNTVINVGGSTGTSGGKGGKGDKGSKGDKGGKGSPAGFAVSGGGKGGKGGPKTGKQSKADAAADHWSGHSGSGAVPAFAGVLVGIICTTLAISQYKKRNAKVQPTATYEAAAQEAVDEYALPAEEAVGEDRSEYSPLIHI